MLHETIAAEESLLGKSLHKSSKIKSGNLCTVKATVKPIFNSAKPGIHKDLQTMETIECNDVQAGPATESGRDGVVVLLARIRECTKYMPWRGSADGGETASVRRGNMAC